MNKRFAGIIVIVAVVSFSCGFLLQYVEFPEINFSTTAPETLVVPDDYPTIQEAIDNAHAGDTVFVKKGTYRYTLSHEGYWTICIDKPLSLIGEDPQTTIINGNFDQYYDHEWNYVTIIVAAPDVTISGFTLTNCEVPIVLRYQAGDSIPNNCKIIGNNFVNNSREIGVEVEESTGHVIAENNITGAGISVAATNTIITANNITGGNTGIHIGMSRDVTVYGNTISHNKIGVILEWWGPYYIYENNITDNQEYGILFRGGINNSTVRDNRIEQNNIGIKLTNYNMSGDATISSGNTVVHNNIIGNSQQVFVERTL